MTTTTFSQGKAISLSIIQPIAISVFTVLVLAASFLVGKHVGFSQGIAHTQLQQPLPDFVRLSSQPST